MFLSRIPKFSMKVSAGSSATIATDANEAGKKASTGCDIEAIAAGESGKRGNNSMEQPSAASQVKEVKASIESRKWITARCTHCI